jgi:hypothetical protein
MLEIRNWYLFEVEKKRREKAPDEAADWLYLHDRRIQRREGDWAAHLAGSTVRGADGLWKRGVHATVDAICTSLALVHHRRAVRCAVASTTVSHQ